MDWLDINEFHNVRIDSKSKCYTDTLSCDEEFYLMAKTNADDGDAVEIHLNLLDKNQAILKTIELESHVENEEVKMTLKIEDLAKENLLDFNAIKEINAEFHYENEKYPTNKVHVCRTLKSKELSDSSELNDIVEGKVAKTYKKGKGTVPNSKGDEIKLVQTSLQKMKINIGDDGVDGVFGNDGHNAVMTFQENYKQTHNVHQYTWGEPDGIVGKNTLLAMDEALVSGWKYEKPTCFCNRDFTIDELKNIVEKLRKSESISSTDLFSDNRSPLQVTDRTYERFTEELNRAFKRYRIDTCLRKSHFIAQAYHETDRFRTTIEYSSGEQYDPGKHPDAERNKNTIIGDGPKYRGRGLMQLTWKINYSSYKTYSKYDSVTNYKNLSTDLKYAVDSAGWYWRNGSAWKDMNTRADKDDIYYINMGINGGSNGFKERILYIKKLIEVMNLKSCSKISLTKDLGIYKLSTSDLKDTNYVRYKNSAGVATRKIKLEGYDD